MNKFHHMRILLVFALHLETLVVLTSAQEVDYCGLLPGFKEVQAESLGQVSLTLGLAARKASLSQECSGGVSFDGESDPASTLFAACQSSSNKDELRLLYNVTESCFDDVRRRTLRDVLLDVGIGVNNGSQFVQFVDKISNFGAEVQIANPKTFRKTPIESSDYCAGLNDPYVPVDAEKVVDLINLGITLYKVSLTTLCPFGIRIEDSLAPARMLVNACQFLGDPDEYRLRLTSQGFCIIQGSFTFGQGYNRNDTYDVLVTRRPPSAYWIFYENSTFSLDESAFTGFAPITASSINSLPLNILPNGVKQLLGVNDSDIDTPTTVLDSSPFVVSTPVSELSDDEILDGIINQEDDSSVQAQNRAIQEIAERALSDGDSLLLEKSFEAATAVNGNTSTLFEQLGGLLDADTRPTAAEALELGVQRDLSESMSQGIADTFQANTASGDQWMAAISRSIRQNSCQPIAQLLSDVREQARNGVIESDFVLAVAQRNSTLLGCLTNCSILDGFVPGGTVTQQIEIQIQIGASRIYEDELGEGENPECPGQGGPIVESPEDTENRLLVICNSRTNPQEQRIFLEVDVVCPDERNADVNRLEVLELSVQGTEVLSTDPLSKFVIGTQES